jgi:hypothetical protein
LYSPKKATKRFQNLIKFIARRYCVNGHFRLSREDLIAEGMLVLVRCCQDFPEGEVHFGRYFKRSLYNHVDKLRRFDRQTKRLGFTVPLDKAMLMAKPEEKPVYLNRCLEIAPHVSPKAREYLLTLALWPPQLCEYAYKQISKTKKISGLKKVRIKTKHIRGYLGLTPLELRGVVREIRDANSRTSQ